MKMDIKAALSRPKTWVTVASVALLLVLGLGPLMAGLAGGTGHAESEYPDLMESLDGDDEAAFVEIVNQELFVFGLWNVTMSLMFLAMICLTNGENQAKLAMVAAGSMLFVSGVGGYSVNGDAYFSEWMMFCAILAVPILITGYMQLNADEE